MIDKINDLLKRVEAFKPQAAAEVEEFRVRMLGRKGEMNDVFEEFKKVAPELKKELGQKINALKTRINDKIAEMKSALENTETDSDAAIDMTRPGSNDPIGSRHPISLVRNEIVDIFARLGYTVAEGPEIEDDWHVFSALNFPPEHPARDMQDTFFIRKTRISCCGRTPVRSRCARWSVRNRRSAWFARGGYSATRPFRTGRTAFFTRSKDFISTKTYRSPT